MFIRTTYVMRTEVLQLLLKAQEKTKLSMEQLLSHVMRKMRNHYTAYLQDDGRIQYQKRYDETTQLPIPKVRVKVKFIESEYNYFQEMRYFFRRSISLVMAIAVFRYLDEVLEEILNSDNTDLHEYFYPYENRAKSIKCTENVPTFKIWWGIPWNLELLFT